MSTKARVAVVGVGAIGAKHVAAWQQEGATVVLLDTPSGRARRIGSKYGADVVPSLDAAFAAVDVVDVCVPTESHESIAIAAAAARLHVICEKPIALSIAAAQRMVDVCGRAGVLLFVAHVGRYVAPYAAAHFAVSQGRIGKPTRLSLTRRIDRASLPSDHWIFDSGRSGGFIVDVLIHDFDFARWILGEVVLVEARSFGGVVAPGADEAHDLVLTHASGAISHVSGALAEGLPPFASSFALEGDAGRITYDSLDDRAPAAEDPYRLELRDFATAIATGTKPRVNIDDGIAALRIALAAVRSQATGLAVDPSGLS